MAHFKNAFSNNTKTYFFQYQVTQNLCTNYQYFFLLKNGPSPASFSFIFGLFQANINTILQQINVKYVHMALGFEPMTLRT